MCFTILGMEMATYAYVDSTPHGDYIKYPPGTTTIRAVGGLISFVFGLVGVIITCTVRAKLRQRDSIPPSCCGNFEDCCCSVFCTSCTQCQMLRHEELKAGTYELCSPTGGADVAERA